MPLGTISSAGEDLTAKAQELAGRREPFVRATVVRAQRPTSAQAGDVALVLASGEIDGFVGGNCVEASVREYAIKTLSSREPLLLRVSPGEPSHVHEEGAIEVSNPCVSGGAIEIFLEPHIPAPRVLVVGRTPIARALVALGAVLGMDMEPAEGVTVAPGAEDAAVIVASHGWEEEPAIEAAVRAGVPYVALVASQVRGAAVLASLDLTDEQRSSVHCPAGIDLGARTPAEIALSILAQLIAERADHTREEPGTAAVETATDPVCGMSVVAMESSLHVEHDGRTVYFCSSGCRAAFLADPQRYAAAS
ncbi:hypothetical protein GCM10027052_29280 [Parafrigoribacterium mesophilum]|uniref:XdhC family protein n=1 Tax=Parafrigoribacterium mesophilum TaxID=433646 RepID=UPI0031FD4925